MSKNGVYILGLIITFLSLISLWSGSDFTTIVTLAIGIGMVLSGYGNN